MAREQSTMRENRHSHSSEHLGAETIARYRHKQLSSDELFALDSHIEGCDACADLLRPDQERSSAMAFLISDWSPRQVHLTYEQLQKLIDGTATREERRNAEAHMADCDRCRADLASLQSYRAELPEELHALNSLLAGVPSASVSPVVPRRQLWWNIGLSTAGAVAASLLVLAFAVYPQTRRLDALRSENARLRNGKPDPTMVAETHRLASENNDLREEVKRIQRDTAIKVDAEAARTRELQRASDIARGKIAAQQKEIAELNAKPHGLILPTHPGENELVAMAMRSGTMPVNVSGILNSGPLSRGMGFGPLRPIRTIVMSDMPELTWTGAENVDHYEIELVPVKQGKPGSPLSKQKVSGASNSWIVTPAVQRGKTYQWNVTAVLKDGTIMQPEKNAAPRFEVATRDKVTRYVKELIDQAILYSNDGLLDDAEAALNAVISVNADADSVTRAGDLLQSLREKRKR